MFSKVCLSIVFCAVFVAPCFANYSIMFTDANKRVSNDGKVTVYWMYNKTMDDVWFKVTAKVTGYVAVGVSRSGTSGMDNYDMAVGGVRSGGGTYLEHYLTKSYSQPPRDTTNNLKLYNATEEGGVTTLVYSRMRITGDSDDIDITSSMDLNYALSLTTDDPAGAGGIVKHDLQGQWKGVNLIPDDMVPTTDAAMVKFTDKQMRSVDGGNFKYYWMVHNNGKMCFKVMAKVKGWVAFGFTKEKSPAMVGFDVIVGGVAADGSSYLKDYKTIGKQQPSADAMQDYQLMMAEEKNDYTTLVFCRKLKTDDPNYDVEIKPGPINVVWAYHVTNDVVAGTFVKHSKRGYDMVTLVEVDGKSSAFLAVPTVFLVLCLAIMQFISC